MTLFTTRSRSCPTGRFFWSACLSVLAVDSDNFRVVNDSLGNAAGDWLITQIAERLGGSIPREAALSRSTGADPHRRQKQSVGGLLARLGGDRFTILLDDIQDASDGIRAAERIQRNIRS